MARKDYEDANPILWILFLTALYISSFFMNLPEIRMPSLFGLEGMYDPDVLFGRNTLSAILSAVFLVLTALTLHNFNNRFSSGLNFILPLLYLILAAANPCAIWFSPFHIAALGLIWSLRYFVKFKAETGHPSDLFTAFFLLILTSCCYLPLIWLVPILLFRGFSYMENKLRYLLTVLLGLFFGAAFIAGLNYLVLGFDAVAALPGRWMDGIIPMAARRQGLSLLRLCLDGLTALLVIIAAVRNIRNQGKYKIAESRMLSDVTMATIILFAIVALYMADYALPFEVMLFAPASLVIFGLFGDSRKSLVTIFSIVIMAIIVAERAMGFIGI